MNETGAAGGAIQIKVVRNPKKCGLVQHGGLNDDVLIGGAGDDTLSGGEDQLYGNAGADLIEGGVGNDTLDSGTGNDVLEGGAGADVFVFNAASTNGADIITDFMRGQDLLEIAGASFASLSITSVSGWTRVALNGDTITLQGLSTLTEDDFVFV